MRSTVQQLNTEGSSVLDVLTFIDYYIQETIFIISLKQKK